MFIESLRFPQKVHGERFLDDLWVRTLRKERCDLQYHISPTDLQQLRTNKQHDVSIVFLRSDELHGRLKWRLVLHLTVNYDLRNTDRTKHMQPTFPAAQMSHRSPSISLFNSSCGGIPASHRTAYSKVLNWACGGTSLLEKILESEFCAWSERTGEPETTRGRMSWRSAVRDIQTLDETKMAYRTTFRIFSEWFPNRDRKLIVTKNSRKFS